MLARNPGVAGKVGARVEAVTVSKTLDLVCGIMEPGRLAGDWDSLQPYGSLDV